MPRIRRNAYQQVSEIDKFEFDRSRIVAYGGCGLLFRDIARRTGRHPTLPCEYEINELLRVIHAGSQRPPMTDAWEDRYFVK
ncbi:unnamed protein product [Larinioides sclopetarius]|uniref:Uncharacterized protein n=1 Tax=Larinioides sclopetarius TaxID=280406 RepID=A0AAV1ZSP4_9ARAC